jgi:hypothetical protein
LSFQTASNKVVSKVMMEQEFSDLGLGGLGAFFLLNA